MLDKESLSLNLSIKINTLYKINSITQLLDSDLFISICQQCNNKSLCVLNVYSLHAGHKE